MTNNKSYFLASNSGRGYYSFFDKEIINLDYVYLLKGAPGNGKSELIQNIASSLNESHVNIELIYSSFNINTLDGIINLDKNVGIFDSSFPRSFDNILPKITGEIIDLSKTLDESVIKGKSSNIYSIQTRKETYLEKYSDCIIKARKLHDDLEKYFSNSINIEKAQQLNNQVLNEIFNNTKFLSKESIIKDRFFDSITEKGNVDFIDNLTSSLQNRYFIKGRPGSGKSTLLKQIVEFAVQRGFNVELYHCDFDPESLDLIIIPELSVCAFDSTDPHNYVPQKRGDKIVDTYQSIIDTNADEKYKTEIKEGTKKWELSASKASDYLKEAKVQHNKMVSIYYEAINKDKFHQIKQRLCDKMV